MAWIGLAVDCNCLWTDDLNSNPKLNSQILYQCRILSLNITISHTCWNKVVMLCAMNHMHLSNLADVQKSEPTFRDVGVSPLRVPNALFKDWGRFNSNIPHETVNLPSYKAAAGLLGAFWFAHLLKRTRRLHYYALLSRDIYHTKMSAG